MVSLGTASVTSLLIQDTFTILNTNYLFERYRYTKLTWLPRRTWDIWSDLSHFHSLTIHLFSSMIINIYLYLESVMSLRITQWSSRATVASKENMDYKDKGHGWVLSGVGGGLCGWAACLPSLSTLTAYTWCPRSYEALVLPGTP